METDEPLRTRVVLAAPAIPAEKGEFGTRFAEQPTCIADVGAVVPFAELLQGFAGLRRGDRDLPRASVARPRGLEVAVSARTDRLRQQLLDLVRPGIVRGREGSD